MANPNINIGVINESDLSTQTQVGKLIFTETGKQFIIKSDGGKLQITDIITVDTLPSSPIQDKIYILSSNFSLNYYDGSWHLLGGSDQISKGTTTPTDTNKLWLDITDSKPILKWYDSITTTWINISGGSVDASTLLDKTTYKGSADGIVKKADTLTNMTSTVTQIDNTVANSISPNIANRSNGKVVTFNASTGEEEWADINITGVIGSTQITTISDTEISSGAEVVFNHPTSTNIIPVIEEQIPSSSVTDTHVDFSDGSKYTLQDAGKILIGNNKAELDIYTKLLMHMDDSNFSDVYGHSITKTNTTLDTTNAKYGSGSAFFNGTSSYLSVGCNSDFNFGNKDFTVDWWEYKTVANANGSTAIHFSSGAGYTQLLGHSDSNIYLSSQGASSFDIANGKTLGSVVLNSWQHLAVVRKGNTFYTFRNGVQQDTWTSSLAIAPSISFNIGKYVDGGGSYFMKGNIDEVRVSNVARWTGNFIPPAIPYSQSYSIVNTPLYVKTTGVSDFSLTTTDTITSLTIPTTIPTNTSIKCLFSVDNYTNYLYYDGTAIKKFIGDITQDWGSASSTVLQIQNLFSNLTMTNLTSMLSGLGITPINLDLVFQLNTADTTVTPTISPITMVYTTKPHTEFASFGGYDESYPKFSVKRVNNSQLSIRNNTAKSRTINVNLVTSV